MWCVSVDGLCIYHKGGEFAVRSIINYTQVYKSFNGDVGMCTIRKVVETKSSLSNTIKDTSTITCNPFDWIYVGYRFDFYTCSTLYFCFK